STLFPYTTLFRSNQSRRTTATTREALFDWSARRRRRSRSKHASDGRLVLHADVARDAERNGSQARVAAKGTLTSRTRDKHRQQPPEFLPHRQRDRVCRSGRRACA